MHQSPTLQLLDHCPRPKYLQLADHFRQQIRSRQLSGHTHLPSINDLSAQYDLSRDTVRKAYMELKRTNLVEAVRGKGYYVRPTATSNAGNRRLVLLEGPEGLGAVVQRHFRPTDLNGMEIDYRFHYGEPQRLQTIAAGQLNRYAQILITGQFAGRASDTVRKSIANFPAERTCVLLSHGEGLPLPYAGADIDWGKILLNGLLECKAQLREVTYLHLCFSPRSSLPKQLLPGFQQFCIASGIRGGIAGADEIASPTAGSLYVISDVFQVMALLAAARANKLVLGRDYRVLFVGTEALPEIGGERITTLTIDVPALLDDLLAAGVSRTNRRKLVSGQLERYTSL